MALSNMFREPRREITESLVGIAVVAALAFADYQFGVWLQEPLLMGMLLGVILAMIFIGIFFVTHTIGEEICDKLEKAGIQMRPRNRRRN